MKKVSITILSKEEAESYECGCCGNMSSSDGFYPCNSDGEAIEPTTAAGWSGLYMCARCGAIRAIEDDPAEDDPAEVEKHVVISEIEGDMQAWTVELPSNVFDQYVNEGCSVRGTMDDILCEVKNTFDKPSSTLNNREFFIDTPMGRLKIHAKHQKDTPDDFPGVFVDLVQPNGEDILLACVEYDSCAGGIYTRVYGDANSDSPTDSVWHENIGQTTNEEDAYTCPKCGAELQYDITDDNGFDTLKGYWICGTCGASGTAEFDSNSGNDFIGHDVDQEGPINLPIKKEATKGDIADALEWGWTEQEVKNGYAVFNSGNDEYIEGARYIADIGSLKMYEGTFDACRQAELDGVNFINDMDGLEKGVYIDTPENRKVCDEYILVKPEYCVENMMAKSPDSRHWEKYREHYGLIEISSRDDMKIGIVQHYDILVDGSVVFELNLVDPTDLMIQAGQKIDEENFDPNCFEIRVFCNEKDDTKELSIEQDDLGCTIYYIDNSGAKHYIPTPLNVGLISNAYEVCQKTLDRIS